LDLITLNAYACAQQIFVPMEAQLFGLQGLELVLELVARVRQRLNPELEVGGAFFTRFDKRKPEPRITRRSQRKFWLANLSLLYDQNIQGPPLVGERYAQAPL
jgi:chromosome partitioning protein